MALDRHNLNALVSGLRAGDAEAWRDLVRDMATPLAAYAFGVTGDWHLARDVAQEAFLAAYRTRKRLRPDSEPRGYCFRIARNLARNAMRDAALRRVREQEASAMTHPARNTGQEALSAELWRLAETLPEKLREVVIFRYRYSLTLAETAATLDLPPGTVSSRQREALEELRRKAGPSAMLPAAPGLAGLLEGGAGLPAVPSGLSTALEGLVMATIAKKTGINVAALVIAALLLGGAGLGAWIVFTPPPENNVAWAPDDADEQAEPRPDPDPVRPPPGPDPTPDPTDETEEPEAESKEEPPVRRRGGTGAPPFDQEAEPEINFAGLMVTISGRVLDPDGRPLPNYKVEVINDFLLSTADFAPEADPAIPGVRRKPGVFAATTSGAGGAYTASFSMAGYQQEKRTSQRQRRDRWLRLLVRVPGDEYLWGLTSVTIEIEPGRPEYKRDDVDVRMARTLRVLCHVTNEAGQPVPNALCWCVSRWSLKYDPTGQLMRTRTDDNGTAEFRLSQFDQDTLILFANRSPTILVEAPGYAIAASETLRLHNVTPGAVIETSVVLELASELTGWIVDEIGTPVANTTFRINSGSVMPPSSLTGGLCTGAGGEFRLEGLPPGEQRLRFEADGYKLSAFYRFAENARDVVVTLSRYASVRIEYRDAGTGEPLVARSFQCEGDGRRMSGNRYRGPLEIEGLANAAYRVTVWFFGASAPFQHEFEIKDGQDLHMVIDVPVETDESEIPGVMRDIEGKPVPHARLTLHDPESETDAGFPWERVVVMAYADDDGEFLLRGVPAGLYNLNVEADGFADHKAVLDLRQTSPEELVITMHTGATLEVEVPKAPPGADWRYELRVLTSDGDMRAVWPSEQVEPGLYRIERLPPGRTIVYLTSSQFIQVPFDNDREAFVFKAEDGRLVRHHFNDLNRASMAGVLHDPRGAPIGQTPLAFIRVGPDHSGEWPDTPHASNYVLTDEQSRWRVAGLAPGRYLVFYRPGVTPGQALVLDITLTAGMDGPANLVLTVPE